MVVCNPPGPCAPMQIKRSARGSPSPTNRMPLIGMSRRGGETRGFERVGGNLGGMHVHQMRAIEDGSRSGYVNVLKWPVHLIFFAAGVPPLMRLPGFGAKPECMLCLPYLCQTASATAPSSVRLLMLLVELLLGVDLVTFPTVFYGKITSCG